jgi:hypothetical protein
MLDPAIKEYFNHTTLVTPFHKIARKESCFGCALLCALVPTILALLVHMNDVAHLQFQLVVCLRGVGHDAAVTAEKKQIKNKK